MLRDYGQSDRASLCIASDSMGFAGRFAASRVGSDVDLLPASGLPSTRYALRIAPPDDARRAAAEHDLAVAGGRDSPVVVVPYDDRWPARSAVEVARLTPLLPGADIHHIGSTAVPRLAAKPVIDLMAFVADLDEPIPALVDAAGYSYPAAYNATLVDRRWLCWPSAAERTHHLHLVTDPAVIDAHLWFRDELRANPELRDDYAQLKLALADRYRDDREGYTEAKAAFIERAIAR